MRNPFDYHNPSLQLRASKFLEFDETAQDTLSPEEGLLTDYVEKSMQGFKILVVLVMVILASRLFYLQVLHGEAYADSALSNRQRETYIASSRGNIKDRNGVDLATTQAGYSMAMVPADVPEGQLDALLETLSVKYSVDVDYARARLKKSQNPLQPVVIKSQMSQQDSVRFESESMDFPGVNIQATPIRNYADAQVFSHIIGYTSTITPDDIAEYEKNNVTHYSMQDTVGRVGVESNYENLLKGTNGSRFIEVDALGHNLKPLGEIAPVNGNDLYLTIDSGLQKALYDSFAKRGENIKGAAVAMDPRTGEVLALVSYPGYNNNLFATGINQTAYDELLQDKNLPLFNRTIQGTYPPGSITKPMTAVAALQEGVINPQTVIVDNGVLVINNPYNTDVNYKFYGWNHAGLGSMNVISAIAKSSDIFFYTVGGGHPSSNINPLGIKRMADNYRRFGLGALTNIDLPGEKPGVVPDPEWKREEFKDDKVLSRWYLGDTYHVSIGQGDLLVTPLQVAEWTATIAMNGKGMKPHLLREAKDVHGNVVFESKPEVIHDISDSHNAFDISNQGMRETVVAGSGRLLADLKVPVAGKTGTSQFDDSDLKKTHAWFTSYAPYKDPQVVITVLVEAGGEGNAVAAPIAKEAYQWWIDNRYGK